MSGQQKICVVCGRDCAGQPRTKDESGRYYHNECYEAAKQKARGASAPPAGDDLVDFGLDEPDSGGMMLEMPAAPSGGGVQCPSCRSSMEPGAVICMTCGYSMQTGHAMQVQVEKAKEPSAASQAMDGFAGMLLSPAAVGMAILVVVGGLAFGMHLTENQTLLALMVIVSSLYVLGAYIFVAVIGFMEGIGHGIMCLICGIYSIYFVLAVTDNQWAKWLFLTALVLRVSMIFVDPFASQTDWSSTDWNGGGFQP